MRGSVSVSVELTEETGIQRSLGDRVVCAMEHGERAGKLFCLNKRKMDWMPQTCFKV